MGTKCKINIQLNQKEYALVHYEMEFGRNKTIKNQAKVLYYAHQGTDTITELCKKTENCYRTVTRILKLYEAMGTDAIYQCKRGKRIHHLEQISDELEAYFDENPLKDVPDIVGAKRENLYLLPMVGNKQISLDF
ncbi:helix-turn-helix domain-containing protein [Ruminococcus sp.]|uniref:helix-turn-helix domain-containing protein n=1 Tax=Ruminococcus sp. TaxID=41978 RepID=UPI0039913F0E